MCFAHSGTTSESLHVQAGVGPETARRARIPIAPFLGIFETPAEAVR
jgi:hypothetical protein